MSTPVMKNVRYKDSCDSVQGSFKYKEHILLAVEDTQNTSSQIDSEIVILSASDYFRCEIGADATAASMMLPPGLTTMLIERGTTISVLRISAADSEISIIIPE